MNSFEIIGILASFFVLLSFVPKDQTKIRVINIIGASLFVIYGLTIGAFSTWFANGALILVHCYHLIKSRKDKI